MIKKIAFGCMLLCLAGSASAQWQATAGYSTFDLGRGFNWGALVVGGGYRISVNERFAIIPAASVGYHVTGKEEGVVGLTMVPPRYETYEIEMGNYYNLQVRGQFQLTEQIYLFAAPSYSLLEAKYPRNLTGAGGRRSEYKDFGAMAGAGVQLTDTVGIEVSYEDTSLSGGVEVLSAQLRFSF